MFPQCFPIFPLTRSEYASSWKILQHEQASTCLIFARKGTKGQILRLSNWMGPFDTPLKYILEYVSIQHETFSLVLSSEYGHEIEDKMNVL